MSKTLLLSFATLGLAGALGFVLEGPGGPEGAVSAPVVKAPKVVEGDGGVRLIAALEQEKLLRQRQGEAWLRVAVEADPSEMTQDRMPVDLTLVIDRSGSMSGAKMKEANRAALEAMERLHQGDRVTVISFDNGAVVHANNLRIGVDDLSGVRAAVRGLFGRGGTDMVAGLNRALGSLDGQSAAQRTRRVLLLSDGHPDTDAGLVDLTRQLRTSGAVMSTLGLGRDYNEDLMAKLADAGTGSYYFVDERQDLASVFSKELDAAAAVVGREAVAQVQLKGGMALRDVLGFEHHQQGQVVSIPLGDIYAGRTIDILSRLGHPALSGSVADVADVTLTFTASDGQRRQLSRPIQVALVNDPAAAKASAVAHVVEKVQKQRAADAYLSANAAFNDGDMERGEQILEQQQAELAQQAASLGSVALQEEASKMGAYKADNRTKDRKAMNKKAKWMSRLSTRGY